MYTHTYTCTGTYLQLVKTRAGQDTHMTCCMCGWDDRHDVLMCRSDAWSQGTTDVMQHTMTCLCSAWKLTCADVCTCVSGGNHRQRSGDEAARAHRMHACLCIHGHASHITACHIHIMLACVTGESYHSILRGIHRYGTTRGRGCKESSCDGNMHRDMYVQSHMCAHT